MSKIPNDPVMLLSYINTRLRDYDANIDACCRSLGIDREEIDAKLASIDYQYDPETNQYV